MYIERGGKNNLLKNYQICEKNIKKSLTKNKQAVILRPSKTNKNSQEDNQHGDKEKRECSTRDY